MRASAFLAAGLLACLLAAQARAGEWGWAARGSLLHAPAGSPVAAALLLLHLNPQRIRSRLTHPLRPLPPQPPSATAQRSRSAARTPQCVTWMAWPTPTPAWPPARAPRACSPAVRPQRSSGCPYGHPPCIAARDVATGIAPGGNDHWQQQATACAGPTSHLTAVATCMRLSSPQPPKVPHTGTHHHHHPPTNHHTYTL